MTEGLTFITSDRFWYIEVYFVSTKVNKTSFNNSSSKAMMTAVVGILSSLSILNIRLAIFAVVSSLTSSSDISDRTLVITPLTQRLVICCCFSEIAYGKVTIIFFIKNRLNIEQFLTLFFSVTNEAYTSFLRFDYVDWTTETSDLCPELLMIAYGFLSDITLY